jgi:hypothetical protein
MQLNIGEWMMLRKLALQTLVLSLLMFLAVGGYAQTSLRSISDFSYLRNDLRNPNQKAEDFIADMRAGNRQAFKYVQYETLEFATVLLNQMAKQYPATRNQTQDRMVKYLVASTADDENRARATLERAILPGIFNLDPRVRLVATDWLRGIRPSPTMQRAVKLAVGVDINVIRYDDRKGQFVFKAPRIIETVASPNEYYREKDLDWPTAFQAGGGGTNNDENLLYGKASQLVDYQNTPADSVTTGLNARRWGDFAPPVYDPKEGYRALTDAERNDLLAYYQDQVNKALKGYEFVDTNGAKRRVLGLQEKYASYTTEIYALDLARNQYRAYPKVEDVQDQRYGAQLLFEQNGMMGSRVPLGQGQKYIYLNRQLQVLIGSPWAELTKLDEFITRNVWWDKIRSGQKSVMTYLSKDTFSTLFRSIDGEMPEYIPFLSFATSRPMANAEDLGRVVDVLIEGLHKNPVLSNRYVILRALKDIYRDKFEKLQTSTAIKEKINVALWNFRREANRLDLQAGRELVAESLTVGKRPANEWAPIIPVSGLVAAVDKDRAPLYFRIPNSEIRANNYQLITTEDSNTTDNRRETRVKLEDLYNARFYAYRQPDNSQLTWYNNQEEFKKKIAAGSITTCVEERDCSWIYNYEQMERAQKLINAVLQGDPEVLRTAIWPDVESAIILTLRRVQLKQDGKAELATTFFDQLRDQKVIVKNPKWDNTPGNKFREQVFVDEAAVAGSYAETTYTEQKREAIKQASLGGLFNRDPRIRLTSIHFLRRLGPDASMLEATVQARSIIAGVDASSATPETDDYLNRFIDTNTFERASDADYTMEMLNRYKGVIADDKLNAADNNYPMNVLKSDYTVEKYEYQMGLKSNAAAERFADTNKLVRYYGMYQTKSPGEELNKLYRLIRRAQLVKDIKRGDINTITNMTRSEFGIMSELVDDEWPGRVPFLSFHTTSANRANRDAKPSKDAVFNEENIQTIKRGIDSKNFLVQKGCAEFLIHFYNFYTGFNANHAVKKEIRDAMYFYKQDDIAVEEFVLAFEGENPDGRAVIMAGTELSGDLNPGGERVYRTLPEPIVKDIRDAVINETDKLPEALKAILGLITARAVAADEDLTYTRGDDSAAVRGAPTGTVPGDTATPPATSRP